MDGCRFRIRLVLTLTAVIVMTLAPAAAWAQIGGGIGGGGGGIGVGGNFQNAGVVIDASGVLRVKTIPDPQNRLGRQRFEAAKNTLDPNLTKATNLRKISLNRLEAAVRAQLDKGEDLPDEMKYLAGLLKIQYVFLYPETNDIVIAGPAEGFVPDLAGRVVGLSTGRATMELQDLIVALRSFPPNGNKVQVIGVSIDPTKEGLEKMQQFLATIAGRVRPSDANRIAAGLRDSLGLQTVSINGVSPKTHFAQVLVEADYRMKLIGIGLQKPAGVKITSYVARANPRSVARDALQRWYFTPNYECIRIAEDEMAMELVGWGVRLVSEAELVQEGGIRVEGSTVDRASQAFCKAFTEAFPKMTDFEPVYAQLRNLVDMAVVAAFIQEKDYYGQANWDLGVFADEQRLPVETYDTPKHVESAVNVIWKGNTLMTPIGGGVNIQPLKALDSSNLMADDEKKVEEKKAAITLDQLAEGQWWWD